MVNIAREATAKKSKIKGIKGFREPGKGRDGGSDEDNAKTSNLARAREDQSQGRIRQGVQRFAILRCVIGMSTVMRVILVLAEVGGKPSKRRDRDGTKEARSREESEEENAKTSREVWTRRRRSRSFAAIKMLRRCGNDGKKKEKSRSKRSDGQKKRR